MKQHPHFSLRLYSVVLDALRLVGPVAARIARHDPDLARQLRRAIASVHLNVAEGMDGRGRLKGSHYQIALGSTNESIAAIEAADALGYIDADAATIDRLEHIRATLLNLVKRAA